VRSVSGKTVPCETELHSRSNHILYALFVFHFELKIYFVAGRKFYK
jgi:hypothetical protein